MERAIELLACIQFLIIGLSHLLQPRAWVDFFIVLRDKRAAGVFANGFLSLWTGTLIVAFHNVWSGLPLVLTLVGWGQVAKALVTLIAPHRAMRSLDRVAHERAWEFQAAGMISLGLGGVLAYVLARG